MNKTTISNGTTSRTILSEAVQGVYVPSSFELHAGASHWGRGRFLMKGTDFDALWPDGGGLGTLTMEDETTVGGTHNGSLAIPVVVAGYRHVAATTTTGGKDDTSDLVEAVVYDVRCKRLTEMAPRYGYNVVDPTDGDYYDSTDNTGSPWSWATVASDLGVSFQTAVSWVPENLVFDGHTAIRAVDMIAETAQEVVGFDWQDGTMKLYPPDYLSSKNSQVLTDAAKYRIGGGDSGRAPSRKPETIRYMFRVVPTDTTFADPMLAANRWYVKDVVTGISGATAGSIVPFIVPNVVTYSGGSNDAASVAAADAIAADINARVVAELGGLIEEVTYAGLWPFVIDGKIQGVRWITDAKGARTVIRKNYAEPFLPWDSGHLAYELMQPTRVSGTGGAGTTNGPAGAIVWAQPTASDSFWGQITGSTAGAIADQWTYTFSEVEKTTAGYGGWTAKSGGRTGDCYNSIEDMNTGVGGHVEGNGVDIANLDPLGLGSPGWAIMPCTTGNVVKITTVTVGETTEYWFSYENGVDGGCPT